MPDFGAFSDEQVVQFLLDHFDDIGVGEPASSLANTLKQGIDSGDLVVEKRSCAFAIVARANRKHPGRLAFIEIPPQADLMFVMVAEESRGQGAGKALIAELKSKYMEGQAMVLVCSGESRKRLFEELGFDEVGLNNDGHYVMICEPETTN